MGVPSGFSPANVRSAKEAQFLPFSQYEIMSQKLLDTEKTS